MPKRTARKDPKAASLVEDGTLNPFPERVSDPKFLQSEFFDPRDVVQVKYEMLRRVSVDNVSVTEASDEYGVSRPTYYQAKASFETAESPGWYRRSGVPAGRTSSKERSWRSSRSGEWSVNPSGRASWQRRSERSSPSRSTQGRSSARSPEKKLRDEYGAVVENRPEAVRIAERYETLRTAALGARLPLEARSGLALFLRRGMWGWAQVAPPLSHTAATDTILLPDVDHRDRPTSGHSPLRRDGDEVHEAEDP